MRSSLLLNGIVIATLLTTPMDWVKLEEPESAAFAASGGADAGASSGLEGHWLNWNKISGWAKLWRGGDGFLVVLAVGHDGCPLWSWGRWVRFRSNWGQNEEVGWSSLSQEPWGNCGFLGKGEEG